MSNPAAARFPPKTGWRGRLTPSRRTTSVRQIPYPESQALKRFRPNAIIQGAKSDVEETLVALAEDFHATRYTWPGVAPVRSGEAVTILVHDITNLSPADLGAIAEWTNRTDADVQIVSTTTTALFALVERGEFPADLYYRLNIVTIAFGTETARA